ncbi:hypothetical protein EDB83DRAFT_2602367 [Lactarius deliciosus]|nr:hypothetical protein EDB83DRAFT_2602367 [Lactarius deliciosus]
MYYDDDDDDDDPYAQRIGPAAMPSPHSRFAPYYSGRANTFEDFLEEYEGLAYDCALTDPQRVDVIIRYVDPSLRDFWRSLSGYHSRDWPQLRQSLVNVFGSTTPRPQVMRQKLLKYVQVASRSRMFCEDDVLRFYRQFICFGLPLVHAGHLSEEERDAVFWCGFHLEDRKVLQPRLLGKNPFQSPDIPFHFEDVFGCARAAFAYNDYFPSPWSHAKQFKPPSLRREQPVVEPAPRDAYSFRAAVVTYAETTPDEFSLSSHSTPFTQLPSSSSPSVSESQYTQAPSVTLDQPEPAYTLSNTLPPSDHPLSHTPALVHLTSDSDSIPAPTFSIPSSTLLPSASFPTLSHASSLARSATDNDPIFASMPPSTSVSSTFPSASPRSHTPSLVHSVTDKDLIPVPTFSIPASTFLPSATEDQSEPEPAPALFASIPTMSSTPSHVHSAINNFASTPPSSSPTSSMCLPTVTEEQHEPETASIPSITPASTFALTPPSSSTFLLSPVSMRSAMNSQPEIESALVSESAIPPSIDHVPEIASAPGLSLPPTLLSASKACSEVSTSLSSPTKLPPPETPTSIPAHSSRPLHSSSGDSSDAVVELVVVPVSLISSSLSLLQGESIPSLPASFEAPLIAHISPRSTPPRLPEIKTIGSVSTQLEVTPSPASPTVPPVPRQVTTAQWLLVMPPALAPRPSLFHSSPSLRLFGTSIRFGFTLTLVTTAVLASILNIPATISTFAHKYWSKQEDIGNNRIGTLNTSSHDVFAQQLRLGQLTPRAPRLVFDPGGSVIAPDLGTRRRSQTQLEVEDIISSPSPRSTPASFIPVSTLDDLIVFDSGGGAFC